MQRAQKSVRKNMLNAKILQLLGLRDGSWALADICWLWTITPLCCVGKICGETIQNSLNYWNRKEGLLIWSTVERINFLFKWNSRSMYVYIQNKTCKPYCKNNEKIPGNLLKKTWKNHGILSVQKSGNPGFASDFFCPCNNWSKCQVQTFFEVYKNDLLVLWMGSFDKRDVGFFFHWKFFPSSLTLLLHCDLLVSRNIRMR